MRRGGLEHDAPTLGYGTGEEDENHRPTHRKELKKRSRPKLENEKLCVRAANNTGYARKVKRCGKLAGKKDTEENSLERKIRGGPRPGTDENQRNAHS